MTAYDRGVEFVTRKKVNDLIAARSESITRGTVSSFEEYKKQAGFIDGLRQALSLMEDARKEIEAGEH